MMLSAAAFALMVGAASSGYAQDPDKFKDLAGYEPYNIRMGSFVAEPSLQVSETYNDNIFLSDTDEKSSFITKVTPGFVVQSDWSRHGVLVEGKIERAFYHQSSNDNYTDYYIATSGYVDITSRQRLTVDLGYSQEHDARGSDNLPGGVARPVEYDQLSARAQYDTQLNRLRITPFAAINNLDFENTSFVSGGTSEQDARDRTESGAGLELGYEFQQGYEAYVRGTVDNVEYDQVVSGVLNRDSNGYGAVAGINVALGSLFDAQFEAGYQKRDFDSSSINDVDGIVVGGALVWNVTPISELQFSASRSFKETSVAGASTGLLTTIGVSGQHALRRNVVLNANASYALEDFEGISREDERYTFGAGVDFILNRYITTSLAYRFVDEDSNVAGEDYQVNRVVVSGKVVY